MTFEGMTFDARIEIWEERRKSLLNQLQQVQSMGTRPRSKTDLFEAITRADQQIWSLKRRKKAKEDRETEKMTSKRILASRGTGSDVDRDKWLCEIAFQLAVMNEREERGGQMKNPITGPHQSACDIAFVPPHSHTCKIPENHEHRNWACSGCGRKYKWDSEHEGWQCTNWSTFVNSTPDASSAYVEGLRAGRTEEYERVFQILNEMETNRSWETTREGFVITTKGILVLLREKLKQTS